MPAETLKFGNQGTYPPFSVVDSSSNFVDQVEIVEFAPTERFFDVPNSSRLQTFLSQILH